MNKPTGVFAFLVMAYCLIFVDPAAADALRIVRISPAGEDVRTDRQIVIQFDRAVVPLGRMERRRDEIPVSITPDVDCQWRWLDRSTLACQLSEKAALRKATRYALTVWPGIKTADGETLEKPYIHEFISQRPRIDYAGFVTWNAPGIPLLKVTFNQPVSKNSVLRHVFFKDAEKKSGKRYRVLANADPDDKNPAVDIITAGDRNGAARRRWIVQPELALPPDRQITFQVEPGLVSALGKEAGVENRTVLAFATFPKFRFNGIVCHDNAGKKLFLTLLASKGQCNPQRSIALNFSAPVLISEVKNKILFNPDLAGDRTDYDPWANRNDFSQLSRSHKKGQSYHVWLPDNLQAAQLYRLQSRKNKNLTDEFGRPLAKPLSFQFQTDHRLPDFKLVHRYAVLESQVESELPVFVTNLDKLQVNYTYLTTRTRAENQQLTLPVPKVEDLTFAIPMKVREMLGGNTGLVSGSIDSVPVVKKARRARMFFAQVSAWQVHIKLGYFNTLVWVTDFATGQPVPGAKVEIYKTPLTQLTPTEPILATMNTDPTGVALLPGTEQLDPGLKTFSWQCSEKNCPQLFVRVTKRDDMAVLPLTNDFEVNIYRASGYSVFPRQRKKFAHIRSWGTTAQGIYRVGETLHYKIYVRNQDNDRFVAAPKKGYILDIIDPSGKIVHSVDTIELSEFGAFNGEFKLPKTAVVGWYQFRLRAGFSEFSWQPMRVLVSDFTPAAFKVSNELNGDLFHAGDELEITTLAKLFSGGAYTDAQVRVNVKLRAGQFQSGHALARGFNFDTLHEQKAQVLLQKTAPLDHRGMSRLSLKLPVTDSVYGKLHVESSVRDDRGKTIATTATAEYLSVDRLVGLKPTRWLYSQGQPAVVQYIVVDSQGVPVADTGVKLTIALKKTVVARVKGAGNAYVTRYQSSWVDTASCEGISKPEAMDCQFVPEKPGTYRITATIEDSTGNQQQSSLEIWVAGRGRVLWQQPNDNSLQIIPEKKFWQAGEQARYLIKNPYPGALALITLERYGVIEQWVEILEGSTPVIEFPVQEKLLPGFYLSVVVMSPRVAKPLPDGQVDLGKPTYKIGYVKVPVKDPEKQIDIAIATDAEVYKPGDTVTATIKTHVAAAKLGKPVELAIVVLDEAVLDLISGGQGYFDPYAGFYRLDALDLRNFSLLTRLIGRQKFEKKGANAGGDGGSALRMRSLFKYVSYWNPSVKTDATGRAKISFELPDNLTGWRILAMAVTTTDKMGLGEGRFKVNQATEIRPVMPNQVVAGDRFQAGFSIMNRTGRERELTVEIKAQGPIENATRKKTKITLGAYQRETVYMDVQTSENNPSNDTRRNKIHFHVIARDRSDGDELKHSLSVRPRQSLLTAANSGSTVAGHVSEPLAIPGAIYPDSGAISVQVAPSVLGDLQGAFTYMHDYSYSCWEQKLSKGVMAAYYQQLQAYLPEDFTWSDSETLTVDLVHQAADYQAPNGGMSYYKPENSHVSPYLSAYTALAFNWLRDAGQAVPEQVEKKLHGYLKKLLRKNISPDYYSKGMNATVRAVALAALSQRGAVSLADLRRYRSHVPEMSLFGKALFMQAAQAVKGGGRYVRELQTLLFAHSQQSAGKLSFSEDLDSGYQRILTTPLRANCSILSALTGNDADASSDSALKLLRTVTQTRDKRVHWENTQENLFCTKALLDYSHKYEAEKPDMNVSVTLNKRTLGKTVFSSLKDKPVTYRHAITAADIGQKKTLTIDRQGKGRLYHVTRISYAPVAENDQRIDAGIDIRREYSVKRDGQWLLLDQSDRSSDTGVVINRGERVRVDIYLSLPGATNFVVVDDPVPGGLEPVNRDLATTSAIDAETATDTLPEGAWWYKFADWKGYDDSRWSFYHQEIRHDRVRFYSDYLPAGRYHLAYTAQAVATGEFTRLPVFAAEMYDPDVFGKGRQGRLIVTQDRDHP